MWNRWFTAALAPVIALSSIFVADSGIASADDLNVLGLRYSSAKTLITNRFMTPVVTSTLGDQLPQDECYVVHASRITTRDSSGVPDRKQTMQIGLNCLKAGASSKNSGFSAADGGASAVAVRETMKAEGRKWKQTTEAGQAFCRNRAEQHPDWAPDPDCAAEG